MKPKVSQSADKTHLKPKIKETRKMSEFRLKFTVKTLDHFSQFSDFGKCEKF